MAGGDIIPTLDEVALIRRLKHYHVSRLLTTLDDDGWLAARELLQAYGARPEYQPQQTDIGEGGGC